MGKGWECVRRLRSLVIQHFPTTFVVVEAAEVEVEVTASAAVAVPA